MSKKIQIVGLDTPQADWNQTDETQLDYIKNKPQIPNIDILEFEQVQADWDQTVTTAKDYIKNKPVIPSIEGLATETFVEEQIAAIGPPEFTQLQSDWKQTDKTSADYINNKPDIEAIVANNIAYTNSEPLMKSVGGILASNHPEGFNNVPINDIITELLYPYTPAVIDFFTLDPNPGTKERNVPLIVSQATVRIIKQSKTIESVDLLKDGKLLQTKTNNITTSGTTLTFDINETLDGSTDTNYQIRVTENDGFDILSDQRTYNFVYPYFYGVVDQGVQINSRVILNCTKVIHDRESCEFSYSTSNQRPLIAYPKSYGALKSIIDHNGFSQKWDLKTVIINNNDTIKNIDYYVYVGGAATATATYEFNY